MIKCTCTRSLTKNSFSPQHDLSRSCKASESLWTVEDAELHVTLIKGTPGEAWPSPFKAHAGEPQSAAQEEADRRRLMLERFQLEVRQRAE